jgi:hypothetical protein
MSRKTQLEMAGSPSDGPSSDAAASLRSPEMSATLAETLVALAETTEALAEMLAALADNTDVLAEMFTTLAEMPG